MDEQKEKIVDTVRVFVAHPQMRTVLDEFWHKGKLTWDDHVLIRDPDGRETVYFKGSEGRWYGYER